MKNVLITTIILFGAGPVFSQAKFEMGYIHPLLNQSYARQIHISKKDGYSVPKFLQHAWLGIFANFSQQYSLSFSYGSSTFHYQYSNASILKQFSVPGNIIDSDLSHRKKNRTEIFRFAIERKFYHRRKYSLWLGINLAYLYNPWPERNHYKVNPSIRTFNGRQYETYESRITLDKKSQGYLYPFSLHLSHKLIFRTRELILKTGLQYLAPIQLDVSLKRDYVHGAVLLSTTETIPSTFMFYVGAQLNRVLRFRNFGSKVKNSIKKHMWTIPDKIDELYP